MLSGSTISSDLGKYTVIDGTNFKASENSLGDGPQYGLTSLFEK